MTTDGSEVPRSPFRPRRRVDLAVAGILLLHFALAQILSFVMLLGYAPDEPRHFAYVRWLGEHGTIPPADENLSGGAHSLHPPLYYALMTPVYLAFRGLGEDAAMRAMRCIAPLFGVAALWLLCPILRRAAGRSRGLFLFMLALLAVWPNLCLCVAMVNNDAASVLMAAVLANVVLVRRWDTRPVSGLIWGAVLGLASLAKFSNFIAGAPLVTVALVLVHGKGWWRSDGFWRGGLFAAGGCLAVCGWWWARNMLVFGALNPYPSVPTLPPGLTPLDAILYGYAWPLLLRAVNGLWTSTWPVIDWVPDALVLPIATILRGLTALGLLGLLAGLWRFKTGVRLDRERLAAIAVPAAGYLGMLAALVHVATFGHMGTYRNGRYLMPFVAGLVILLALSWRQVIPPRLRMAGGVLVILFLLFFNGAAWYHLLTHWNPLVSGG
ncbi:MAG: hypothetical protein KBI47_10820 [Armatimonadetes bacterium]|nr:hypothetical protein [Armatimonadota bacterium]MDI9585643.1 glycosyltransferase family 39 protein [Acidobacteriota bacterium]